MGRIWEVGKVLSPRGLGGELKIRFFRADPAVLDAARLLIEGKIFEVERSVFAEPGVAIVKLRGVADRTAAETFIDAIVSLDAAWFGPNDGPSERLIGAHVVDADSGQDLGLVTQIFDNGAQELLVVGEREQMIPLVDAFVDRIALEDGALVIRVRVIPGLFE